MKERWSSSNDKLVALESGHSIEGDELQKEKYTKSKSWCKTLQKYSKSLILLQISILLLWIGYEMWQTHREYAKVHNVHSSSQLYPDIFMKPQNQFADSAPPEIITAKAETDFEEVSKEGPTPKEDLAQFPKDSLENLSRNEENNLRKEMDFYRADVIKNILRMISEKSMKGDDFEKEYNDDLKNFENWTENDLVTEEPVTDESLTKNDETTSNEETSQESTVQQGKPVEDVGTKYAQINTDGLRINLSTLSDYQDESNEPFSNIEESPEEESSERLIENSTEETSENIPSTSTESITNVNLIGNIIDKEMKDILLGENSQLEFGVHPFFIDLASNINQFTTEKEDTFSKLEGFDESVSDTDYPSDYEEYDSNSKEHDWNDTITACKGILKIIRDYDISDTLKPVNDNEESSEADKNLDSSTIENTTETANMQEEWSDYKNAYDSTTKLDETLEGITIYFDKDIYDTLGKINDNEESNEADENLDSSTIEDATTTEPAKTLVKWDDYEYDYDYITKLYKTFKDDMLYFDKHIYGTLRIMNDNEEGSKADKNLDSSTIQDATMKEPATTLEERGDYDSYYDSTEYLKFLESIRNHQIEESEKALSYMEYMTMNKLMWLIRKLKHTENIKELISLRENILIELRKSSSEKVLKELVIKLCNDRDWYTIAVLSDSELLITVDDMTLFFDEIYSNIKRHMLSDSTNPLVKSVFTETDYTNLEKDDSS